MKYIFGICIVFFLVGSAGATGPFGMWIEEKDDNPSSWIWKLEVPNTSLSVSNYIGTIDFSTWGDASYLRLDAANDPVTAETHFGAGIRGDAAGCSTITSLVVDGAPGRYNGHDYTADVLEGGCSEGAVGVINEEISAALVICGEGPGRDVSSVISALGTDSVRLCLIDFSSIIAPETYASLLMPSSDSCVGLLDTFLGGPGHGFTADVDDSNFLTWNADTCEYDDRNRSSSYTIVSGWSDPVDVTTGSEMTYEWAIQSSGDSKVEDLECDSVKVGNDPDVGGGIFTGDISINSAGVITTDTDQSRYGLAILKPFTTTEAGPAATGGGGGLYVSVSATPSHDIPAVQFQAGNYESLIYTDNTFGSMEVMRFKNYAWGDFTLTDGYTSVSIQGPSVGLANSDPTTPYYYGIDITDWTICGTCTVTVPDNVGINIGAMTAGTNNYGIKTAADVLLTDDVKMLFGTDEDIALSSSTADQLDLTPNTSNGDVTITAVGTGGIVTDGSFQAASYKAGSGTAGVTDSSSYWLCTAADCSSTCQVTIEDGLITGCP